MFRCLLLLFLVSCAAPPEPTPEKITKIKTQAPAAVIPDIEDEASEPTASAPTGKTGASGHTGATGQPGATGLTGVSGTTGPSGGPVEQCSDLGATDCFSNDDCGAGTRCQNAGDADNPVACCLPGVRGTAAAGESCTANGELDCVSAVCVGKSSTDWVCSQKCTQNSDCPTGMKRCTNIAFSSSAEQWCLPE